MRLPPQVSAVHRPAVDRARHTTASTAVLPAGRPTGESISCWGPNPQALVCTDSHGNPIGAACCPNSTTTAAMEDGLCVCQ
jgi:hypothetical protein